MAVQVEQERECLNITQEMGSAFLSYEGKLFFWIRLMFLFVMYVDNSSIL